MTSLKWYEELFSKTNGTRFDDDFALDSFKIKVHQGENIFAEWDITEELREHGMTRKNYSNASLNVDFELIFLHDQIREEFKNDESLKNILRLALNDSLELGLRLNSSASSRLIDEVHFLPVLHCAQAVVLLLIGMIGLSLKLRAPFEKRIVKVTKCLISVWCILIGVLAMVFEYSENEINRSSTKHEIRRLFIVVSAIANTLTKILVMSLKIFTITIYAYQNLMIFRPFIFRQHKKALSKWLLLISLGQWLALSISFMVWSLVLIYNDESCSGVESRSYTWQIVVIGFTFVGYIGSLLLSLTFLIGYYRKNSDYLGKFHDSNIKKTFIACSIEVLFDCCVLAAIFGGFQYFSLDLHDHDGIEQPLYSSSCDILTRIVALDSGLSKCVLSILIVQPTLQEIFSLIFELVEYSDK